MVRLFSFFLLCTCLVAACRRSTPDEKQEILALKEMSDLATVEYVVTKIIRANDDKTWYKFGDRKILMSCQATLKAGIDFSKISENDISIHGKEITLQLTSCPFDVAEH